MAGSKEGGRKAARTNLSNHGPDFYKKIGAEGGKNGNTGGFASNIVGKDGLTGRQRARSAGVKGGQRSRRSAGLEKFKDYYELGDKPRFK